MFPAMHADLFSICSAQRHLLFPGLGLLLPARPSDQDSAKPCAVAHSLLMIPLDRSLVMEAESGLFNSL